MTKAGTPNATEVTDMKIEVERNAGKVAYEVRLEGYAPAGRSFDVSDAPEEGIDWAVALEPAKPEPADDPVPPVAEADPVRDAPSGDRPRRADRRNGDRGNSPKKVAADKVGSRDKSGAEEKGVAARAPEDGPARDPGDKGAPAEDKPRKPNVTLLDGGGARKPKVGLVGGADKSGDDGDKRKTVKVPALE